MKGIKCMLVKWGTARKLAILYRIKNKESDKYGLGAYRASHHVL